MKKIFFAVVLMIAFGFSSFAQQQNFTLVNGCDFIITHVYITPTQANEWGEDVLTVDVLAPDEECDISFTGYSECGWDIQAYAEDGSYATWTNIDLCQYYVITLTMTDDGPYAIME